MEENVNYPDEGKNYDFVQQQVFYTGVGDALDKPLKEGFQSKQPEFVLAYDKKLNEADSLTTFRFQKSKQSDMYFLNRMIITATQENGETVRQSFLFASKGANFTIKECVNMMMGRAVYKEGLVYKKDGVEKKYNAWNELNPNDVDAYGNKKITRYNEKYGYVVEKTLQTKTMQTLFPELSDPKVLFRAAEELKRGDRYMATMVDPETNNHVKHYLVASPYDRQTKVFDLKMNPVELKLPKLEKEKKETQSEGQDQKLNQKETPSEEVRQKGGRKQRA